VLSKPCVKKTQPIKTGKFGPNLTAMDMQSNPLRAAYEDGHGLNESYKMPVPNASGKNLSYHRPVDAGGGASSKTLSAKQKMPAGPVNTGKNTF
jgi:hypothetical protein